MATTTNDSSNSTSREDQLRVNETTTITKQRRRQSDSSTEEQPGAVQIDERAPHVNQRFFQGLTRPSQRLRAREECAAARRQQQNAAEEPSSHSQSSQHGGELADDEVPSAISDANCLKRQQRFGFVIANHLSSSVGHVW